MIQNKPFLPLYCLSQGCGQSDGNGAIGSNTTCSTEIISNKVSIDDE
jgi:hypothetical protein